MTYSYAVLDTYTTNLPSILRAFPTGSNLMPTVAPPPPDYALSSFLPMSQTAEAAFLDEQFGEEQFCNDQESGSAGPSRTKRDDKHIRRPANPFILFACDYRRQEANRNRNNRHLSKEAGLLWRLMPKPEKDKWIRRASEVKDDHSVKHPEYRFKPRRRDAVRLPSCTDAVQDDSGVYFYSSPPPQNSPGNPRKLSRKRSSANGVPSDNAPSTVPTHFQRFERDTHQNRSPPERTTSNYEEDFDDDFFESLHYYSFATTSAAEPPCGTSQQSITPLENEFSCLRLSQLENDPRQIPAPHFGLDTRSSSDSISTYTLFDQPLASGTAYNHQANTHSSTSEYEAAPFFNSFGLPVQADVCGTSSANFDSTFDSFFFDSNHSYRR